MRRLLRQFDPAEVSTTIRQQLDLNDFPANVLEGHRRKFAALLFVKFQFDPFNFGGPARDPYYPAIISWLGQLEQKLTFEQQERDAKADGTSQEQLFFSIGISRWGMRRLGLAEIYAAVLGTDSDKAAYPAAYSHDLDTAVSSADVVLKLAHNDPDTLKDWIDMLKDDPLLRTSAKCSVKYATRLFRHIEGSDRPLGPLGFWDGISQPPKDHLAAFTATRDPWLNSDERKGVHYGSTLSFLDIKVDRIKFEKVVKRVAAKLFDQANIAHQGHQAFTRSDFEEEVAAVLMGRYRNGRPRTVELVGKEGVTSADWKHNNWRFTNSGDQRKDQFFCPYMAHIRAVNPRAETSTSPQILRRGMLSFYPPDASDASRKTGDALFFMSYQSDLSSLQQLFDQIKDSRDIIVYNQKETVSRTYNFSVVINGELFTFSESAADFSFVELESENYFYIPPRAFFTRLKKYSTLNS